MNLGGKILAIVPARGGSKRLARKNLAPIGGRPLLAWTVASASESGIFEQIRVSSDDPEILAAATAAGGVPLVRPADLGADNATVAQVCSAALRALAAEGEEFSAVYVLLPTSPLRSAESIRRAWALFAESDADALASVRPLAHPPEWALDVEDGWVRPLDPVAYEIPRPALRTRFRADGAHSIVRARHLLASGSLIGPRTLAFVTPAQEAVDIDEPMDLEWAEFLLSRRS